MLSVGTDGPCGIRNTNMCTTSLMADLALGRVPPHGHVCRRVVRLRVRLSRVNGRRRRFHALLGFRERRLLQRQCACLVGNYCTPTAAHAVH